MSSTGSTSTHAYTNRLAQETSPYLLQHAHNPVDWYAWGPEAFAAARSQNKPIFLSVGYSTCYWCHVMERQCFENPEIAKVMNDLFINIKVDREERPDVDQLYMLAVQVLTRHGGWPMSVFLTPDLRPFFGGTYFPPTDNYGRPGFPTLLRSLSDAYKNRIGDVNQSAEQIVDVLNRLAEPAGPRGKFEIDLKFIEGLIDRSVTDYDPVHGGFGSAPKFPRETQLELLLSYTAHYPNETRLKQITHTLDALALGGIRDQLGGGFHRYSTDAKWLVPHFEIMLYDNAMLAWCYIEAYRQTENPFYAKTARGVLDFVLREMTSPEGAFYTAFDAEVDAMEGLSYLWTEQEIVSILGEADARVFNEAYGVDQGPNFEDPHHGPGHPDKSILYLPKPLTPELDAKLEPMRQKLYQTRLQRKQPLLDTKILTSWNALMIRAFAYGGQVLQEERYVAAAEKAADFILRHHRTTDSGLYRTSRDGVAKYNGFLDDYAFLIQALLELRDSNGREVWKDHAAALTIMMINKFGDDVNGGFYFTEAGADDLIVRQKVASDSPLPSGNAVAAMALQELGHKDHAKKVISVFGQQLEQQGEGMSSMVQAAFEYVHQLGPIEVAPRAGAVGRPSTPQEQADAAVTLSAEWVSPTELHLKLDIADGYHLNAHETIEGLFATRLDVSADADVTYDRGTEARYPFADSPLRVYEDSTLIRVTFKSAPKQPIDAALMYQACTNDACLAPVTKRLEIPVS